MKKISGGENAQVFPLSNGPDGIKALLSCRSGIFSKNITRPAPIFECKNGEWEDVPDCVPYTARTTSGCSSGSVPIKIPYSSVVCGKSFTLFFIRNPFYKQH